MGIGTYASPNYELEMISNKLLTQRLFRIFIFAYIQALADVITGKKTAAVTQKTVPA